MPHRSARGPAPPAGAPLAAVAALAALLVLATCSRGGGEVAADPLDAVTLDVFAAASLTDAFVEIAAQVEQSAGVDVRLTFAGSQTLRLQLEQGARADLFASADRAHVVALQEAGVVATPLRFASNELALVVPANGNLQLSGLADLADVARLVVGTDLVPVGVYTEQLVANGTAAYGPAWRAGVLAAVVSREANVRLLRAKVELGEADAGVVYRSDTIGREALRPVPIPASLNVVVAYYIAEVVGAGRSPVAGSPVALEAIICAARTRRSTLSPPRSTEVATTPCS